jgi:citrate lyase subunit beta / citryl-CoA lyase
MSALPGPALLFCPADRPERFQKALDRADGVILDLEDAVAPTARSAARRAVRDALGTEGAPGPLDPDRVIVRINPLGTSDAVEDLAALAGTRCRTVMIAKAEHVEHVEGLEQFRTIQLVETLRGLDRIDGLASLPGCVGLMWGGDDLTADLGGRASRRADSTLLPHAEHLRIATLLAARRHGILALDGPMLALTEEAGLVEESRTAAAMGFWAKTAIHPAQVDHIRRAFYPSEEELRRARGILAATASGGVTTFEGRMVDGPVIAQARAIVSAAERTR